jgi:hypothetical protein
VRRLAVVFEKRHVAVDGEMHRGEVDGARGGERAAEVVAQRLLALEPRPGFPAELQEQRRLCNDVVRVEREDRLQIARVEGIHPRSYDRADLGAHGGER